jgi:hypothetical protein
MSDSSHFQAASATAEAAWVPALDALAAAPDHHTLLYENDRVRVLDTCIRPGDQTPVHTHRWPAALYVLSWSHFLRYDEHGVVLLDSSTVPALRNPPPALWSAPLPPHSLRNVGDGELHIISLEVKE